VGEQVESESGLLVSHPSRKQRGLDGAPRILVGTGADFDGLHQLAADEVEGLLAGPLADAVSVAAEVAFKGLVGCGIADGDVDAAYGFGFCAATGAGDSGDSEA